MALDGEGACAHQLGKPGNNGYGVAPMRSNHPKFTLKLFIAGETLASRRAVAKLRRICEEQLAGHYEIEIIDVLEHPELAEANAVAAVPTLLQSMPHPIKQVLGNLSDTEKVLLGLKIYAS